jgi:hypothetical protein
MTYPVGTRVRRVQREDPHAQMGTLTRPWQRIGDFPHVQWDGEERECKPYPECVEPIVRLAQERRPAPVAVGDRDAWAKHGERRRV